MAGYTPTSISATYEDLQEQLATNNCKYVYNELIKRDAAQADQIASAAGDVGLAERFLALEGVAQNSQFGGLYAGSTLVGVTKPTQNHLELPVSGLTLNINDYPALYAQVAPLLTEWTGIASGTNADLFSVIYSEDRFIVAGANVSLYSLDGITISTAATPPNGVVNALAWNGLTGASRIVIGVGLADYVGATAGVTAGESWSTLASGLADSNITWSDVKWFAGNIDKFVAIGSKLIAIDTFESYIISSPDGNVWTLEKTLAGRFESIAYNDYYGSSNEFVIVGIPGLGDTVLARLSSTLNGTWAQAVTFGGGTAASLNSVEYYDDGSTRGFATCGDLGVVGSKAIAATNFTAATPVQGTPTLNRVVADDENQVFYAMGAPIGGIAYIYKAEISLAGIAWTPQSVGSYPIYGYAVGPLNTRVVVGAAGSLLTYTGASADTFTIPYPLSASVLSPFKVWLLAENAGTPSGAGGGAGITPSIDLSKLENNWKLIQIEDGARFVRGLVQNNEGVIVAYGDAGLLFKSEDFGVTWADIGTALSLSGNITSAAFAPDGQLGIVHNGSIKKVSTDFSSESDLITGGTFQHIIYSPHSTGYFVCPQTPTSTSSIVTIPAYKAIISGLILPSSNPMDYPVTNTGVATAPLRYNSAKTSSGAELIPISYTNAGITYSVITKDSLPPLNGNDSLTEVLTFTDFIVQNQAYSNAWEQYMFVGIGETGGGAAYIGNSTLTTSTQQNLATAGIGYEIEDAVAIEGKAWVLFTRFGIHVLQPGADPVFHGGTAVHDRGIFINKVGRFALVTNHLAIPGVIARCDITGTAV